MGIFENLDNQNGQQPRNPEQAALQSKLLADTQPAPPERMASGYERIPTQLPGDRFDARESTAYRANLGMVAQYKEARQSVAYIETQTTAPVSPGTIKEPTTGSGFVATADGRIVTSYHVVKDSKPGTLSVTLPDGKKYNAQVEHLDPKTELAVLRLQRAPGETFKPLAMADSSDLKPGDRVAALGYPRGVKEVFLSVGGRWQSPSPFESPSQFALNKMFIAADGSGFLPGGFREKQTLASLIYDKQGKERIQGGLLPGEDPNRMVVSTDLKVEPGNSGGPLLNQQFKAIGVVGLTDVRGSKAVSTPIEDVKAVLRQARVFEKPNEPIMSLKPITENPTNLFPFLRAQPPDTSMSNKFEPNTNSTSLQYRLKERLLPRK